MSDVLVSTSAPAGWDERVRACAWSEFYQTAAFATFASDDPNAKTTPFFFECTGSPLATPQTVETSASWACLVAVQSANGALSTTAALPYHGPAGLDAAKRVLDAFSARAAGPHAAATVRLVAPWPEALKAGYAPDALGRHLRSLGFSAKTLATFLVPLTGSDADVLGRVDKAARKLVRRTREQGVLVKPVQTPDELAAYWRVVNESRAREGLGLYAPSRAMLDAFTTARAGALLVAWSTDGQPLAALGVSVFNGVAHEWGSGVSDLARERKVYANDLLKFEALLYAKRAGCTWFDLTGVESNPAPGSKEDGIRRFKAKWGGVLVPYESFERLPSGLSGLAAKARHALAPTARAVRKTLRAT